MDSFLVCGYGSTTLLESSYLGVPSAQFVCGELDNKKTYHNRSRITGHEKAFNILNNEEVLIKLIKYKNWILGLAFSEKVSEYSKSNVL